MRQAICTLKSLTPYSQSQFIETREGEKINYEWELKRWRERMHVRPNGMVYIPSMAFTHAIRDAAQYLSIKAPGNGTFTKHFTAGVRAVSDIDVGIHRDDVEGEERFVPSNGQKGGGSRVKKIFPYIPKWAGDVTFMIADDVITKTIFHKTLVAAGGLIGIGRFRPIRHGHYGMFSVEKYQWIGEEGPEPPEPATKKGSKKKGAQAEASA